MIIVSPISPQAVAALPSEWNVQCVLWEVYLCVCVSLCLSLHCLWFLLISLKPYVFCHVLVFWMLAYGCHLFSPPAPLPPCLLPHFSFICMLFLLFHTSLLNCHVLSLCAQTLRPALNLQLMVGISTFLFMWLVLTCILSLQHAYFYCCTADIIVPGCPAWKCQLCVWCRSFIDYTDLSFEATKLLPVRLHLIFFALIVPHICLYHLLSLHRPRHSTNTPFFFLKFLILLAGTALVKWWHQLTNYSVSLKVPQRNKTHSEARTDYINSMRWFCVEAKIDLIYSFSLIWMKMIHIIFSFCLICIPFFIILWPQFHNLCEQIPESMVMNFLLSMCSVLLHRESVLI